MSNMILNRCISCLRSNNVMFNNVKYYASKRLPIISCKRKDLNFFGETSSKSDDIPLASNGWNHKKSRGDYFIIHGNAMLEPKADDLLSASKTFKETQLSCVIADSLEKEKMTTPTEIQSKSIPILLSGKNSLITAHTGCGKTLAYLLPILEQILKLKAIEGDNHFNSPAALIITPSRELAQQINTVAEALCQRLSLKSHCVVGGSIKHKMLHTPFEKVDVLVASLGALSKLVTMGVYKIDRVHHLVLDEADTLLDDSFHEKLSYFLKKFPFQYQCTDPQVGTQLTLVSATMPNDYSQILSNFVDPTSIVKISTNSLHKALPHVPQRFLRLGSSQKPVELLKLVRSDVNKKHPVMIFSNRTATSDWVSMFLNENGIHCVNLNGTMLLKIKEGVFNSYQKGIVNVLSCTDVASRGLDTIMTRHVINYDFPLHTADYIHRCGRTGRIGSSPDCYVTNFVSSEREVDLVQKMEMSFREMKNLPNVNGNITKVIRDRISGTIGHLQKKSNEEKEKLQVQAV